MSSVLFYILSENQSFLRGFLYPRTSISYYNK